MYENRYFFLKEIIILLTNHYYSWMLKNSSAIKDFNADKISCKNFLTGFRSASYENRVFPCFFPHSLPYRECKNLHI